MALQIDFTYAGTSITITNAYQRIVGVSFNDYMTELTYKIIAYASADDRNQNASAPSSMRSFTISSSDTAWSTYVDEASQSPADSTLIKNLYLYTKTLPGFESAIDV